MKRACVVLTKSVILATAALLLLASASAGARQAASVAGTWKLNEAESNNPNGPAPAAPAARRGGGSGGGATGGGRGGGGNFDATGGAAKAPNQAVSELSPEEKTRINMMLSLSNKAAAVLEIIVDAGTIAIKQDGGGFPKQSADGKKNTLKNPQVGEIDIKVKLDNKGMTREISTQEDLKIVENYVLSADGKQLTVTIKESHPVMKIEDMKIKRVYYRQ